ncbi:MAG TPA: heavy-metal-associated domain-containing protein [Chitinophagaceae bacterium]|nr:heavy-metal-associated domain-containing protein [Chitinophagaceae bacterium]
MKTILLIAATIFLSVAANSQVTKVSLQASGLTCSMCSNAIYRALKSLDFVDKIDANIKTSTFEITFKLNRKVDFDKLKNKVEGAGFSVAGFTAAMQFNNVKVKSNEPITVGDKTLQFVNVKEQTLTGLKTIKVIDKGFVSAKEYKKNSLASADTKGGKLYHVNIII